MDAHLFVIFGGSGDLAKRKLLPAIAAMVRHAGEPACHVLGVGRTPLDETDYQHLAAQSVAEVMGESDATAWAKTNVHYASTDDENGGFEGLAERIVTLEQANGLPGNRVFYLAIPPT
ncbi:MAG: glucose-6-phosphate dehydrogenase, partial [Acidimicrobiia bacterium]|nr:glucose-6-phosphate dehydrogenase [Acidimicrobiia bacterium]